MSNLPADLKYTESHEWVRVEADGTLTVGITDHAQDALGDIVFVEVQAVSKAVSAGDTVAVVESVKAASDIYAPVSGEIIEANSAVSDAPESINGDAYGAWLFKVKPTNIDDVSALLSADDYAKSIGA
ncbi:MULTISPECIES: glycine cleavage system protein GcvH [Ralstonia]|jgi:glycine cleavage system H protein|uniref:Glycine cleavage system H protein n=1 Tax=Ralstonia flaminis TaxID=3058597 RepID=A0ABN9JJ40_9RALS|nr:MULTISPECIES: glycine cleavage system protein GcvH [unclassified Ralstonia]CAJ0813551.1 Glycine cleavage system H protein [Ralstonia sp. LMG 18101]